VEIATFERILIVVAFLGVLALVLVFIRIAKGSGRLPAGVRHKPMRVVSSQVLGPEGRAVVLDVDGRSVLVVLGRKGGTTALDLGSAQPVEAAQ
jgi:flagellar biogenesis protein FliO